VLQSINVDVVVPILISLTQSYLKMSSSIAGPSQPHTMPYPMISQPQVLTNQMDLKRRMEGDSDSRRALVFIDTLLDKAN